MLDPKATHILVVNTGIGPDQGNTAMGFIGIKTITIDLVNMIIRGQGELQVSAANGFIAGSHIREFDLATISSGTITITNGVFRLDLVE